MSEYKEERPLLHDSDEESRLWPGSDRRARHPYGGRARARVNGAALIIKNWPDHLSSLWVYWWTGFGMIAITIFIIYNSISIVDVVTPKSGYKVPTEIVYKENIHNADQNFPLDIYIHTFVNNYEDVKDDFYLKHIKTIAKKFTDYRYNFIVVLNDMSKSSEKDMSAKSNNDIAMKSILNSDKIYHSSHRNNISVQYLSLSNYLDSSPVKGYWRQLPLHILEFLTRCIAIWDRGGIAFDPIIITPLSPNVRYMENLQNILKKHKKYFHRLKQKEERRTFQSRRKQMPKVNNIQDIINILESNNTTGNIPQYNLSEADNKENLYYIKTKNNPEIENSRQFKREIIRNNISNNNEKLLKINESTRVNTITGNNNPNNITEQPKKEDNSQMLDNLNDNVKRVNFVNQEQAQEHLDYYLKVQQNSSFIDRSVMLRNISDPEQVPKLIIDLKGIIIASKTPCHAFIGTMFSNLRHYTYNDSLENVISNEVSLFCKGALSSCKYIDVIVV